MYDYYEELLNKIPKKHEKTINYLLKLKNDMSNKKKYRYLGSLDIMSYKINYENIHNIDNIDINTYRTENELRFNYLFKKSNMNVKLTYTFLSKNIQIEVENDNCIMNIYKRTKLDHLTAVIIRPYEHDLDDMRLEVVANKKYLKNTKHEITDWSWDSYSFMLSNLEMNKEDMKDLMTLNFDFNFNESCSIDVFNFLYQLRDNILELEKNKTLEHNIKKQMQL